MNETKYLHLHPGAFWHDDAAIVGTRAALEELRDAINAALNKGSAVAEASVKDGEGYWVFVHAVDGDEMMRMALPYTDKMAREPRRSKATWPYQLEHRAEAGVKAKIAAIDKRIKEQANYGYTDDPQSKSSR